MAPSVASAGLETIENVSASPFGSVPVSVNDDVVDGTGRASGAALGVGLRPETETKLLTDSPSLTR